MKKIKPVYFLILFIWLSVLFYQCGTGESNGESSQEESRQERIKRKQYLIEGKRLYLLHCSNCHQEDGSGLARLYPPLKESDYLKNNEKSVICSIKYGQSGEITVNGVIYNQPMPSNLRLTDLEIAEIGTYIYNTWGGKKKLFTHREIDQILGSCQN
jgi:mono/diheme cytochrome c family protein